MTNDISGTLKTYYVVLSGTVPITYESYHWYVSYLLRGLHQMKLAKAAISAIMAFNIQNMPSASNHHQRFFVHFFLSHHKHHFDYFFWTLRPD